MPVSFFVPDMPSQASGSIGTVGCDIWGSAQAVAVGPFTSWFLLGLFWDPHALPPPPPHPTPHCHLPPTPLLQVGSQATSSTFMGLPSDK